MPEERRNVEINTSRITVGRGIGSAVLIAMLLVAMFVELPGIRGNVLMGVVAGLVFALVLILWRGSHLSD